MEKILVVGAFKAEDKDAIEFVKQLGTLIARKNLILLNGCQNELDRLIAESVNNELIKLDIKPESRIITTTITKSSIKKNKVPFFFMIHTQSPLLSYKNLKSCHSFANTLFLLQ